jgi:chromosome segregation ATPase
MTGKKDTTLVVLRQIRDEIRNLGARVDLTNERLDLTNERLEHVDTALLDLAEQQRFVVKHIQTLTSRDRRLEHEIGALRERVAAIELRLGSG